MFELPVPSVPGTISMAASLVSIGKNLQDSVKLWNSARGAESRVGSEIQKLQNLKEITPEVSKKISDLQKLKEGLEKVKLALSVRPVATVVGVTAGAVMAGKSSDWKPINMLSGAMVGANIGNNFSGVRVGMFKDLSAIGGDLGYEIFTGRISGELFGTFPVQAKVYGISIYTADFSMRFSAIDGFSANLNNFSGRDVAMWSGLF